MAISCRFRDIVRAIIGEHFMRCGERLKWLLLLLLLLASVDYVRSLLIFWSNFKGRDIGQTGEFRFILIFIYRWRYGLLKATGRNYEGWPRDDYGFERVRYC